MFLEKYELNYHSAIGEHGVDRATTNITVEFDSSYIESTLNGVRDFLQAAGYGFIARLIAVSEDGTEVAKSDV